MYVCILHLLRTKICHANGDGKSIVCLNRRCGGSAADYIQKVVLKRWVFNLDLKGKRHLADWMSLGSRFHTASDALVKVRCPAVDLSPVGMVSRLCAADLSPGLAGLYTDTRSAR